jgi:hypothetical protein
LGGPARDYLNAPIDTWLTFYNFGYLTSVTPEDGLDVTSSIRSNVIAQSVVVTRTMDFGGRTGGISVVLPYVHLNASSDAFRAPNNGFSDLGFLFQVNIFSGPALSSGHSFPRLSLALTSLWGRQSAHTIQQTR